MMGDRSFNIHLGKRGMILAPSTEEARIRPLHKAWNLKIWPFPWKENWKNST